MKKFIMAAIGLMMAVSVSAQNRVVSSTPFYAGKWMVGASATGFDLSYHKGEKWRVGLEAKAGYLFVDNWMITGKLV